MNADLVLKELTASSVRFVKVVSDVTSLDNSVKGRECILEQKPSAILLGCSVSRVPAVHPVVVAHESSHRDQLLHRAMWSNVEKPVEQLQLRSRIIRRFIDNNQLKIVGAGYSIETGKVEFH